MEPNGLSIVTKRDSDCVNQGLLPQVLAMAQRYRAAGDVRAQLTRQITTAVGDATTATIAASKWVEERARGNEANAQ